MHLLNHHLPILFAIAALVIFAACSEYPEMDENILAYHVFNEGQFDVGNDDDEYVDLVSKSFGMTSKEVRKIQKTIISKKTESNLRYTFEGVMHSKIVELLDKNSNSARKDFIVNVLAPYLNVLSKNEPYKSGLDKDIFENDIIFLFGKFFKNSAVLGNFIDDIYRYNHGGVSSTDYLNLLNETLAGYNLFVDWNPQNNLNVLKVEEIILLTTPYKGKSITVLNLRRIVPGLMPPKLGYYTAGSNQVVLLDDMIDANVEEVAAEIEQGRFFSKYEDKRFEKFWRSIGLNLNVEKASKIYKSLMKKDFAGHTRSEIKVALAMETAVHEAKHLADQIEHPELTLNLDAEFSAHVTAAMFNPAPNATLFSAIRRMENYAMNHQLSQMNEVVRKLWEMAIRSANEELYTDDSLRQDLLCLYNDYRTIRERASFETLDDFHHQIASKIAEHYNMEDVGKSLNLINTGCTSAIPHSKPTIQFQEQTPLGSGKYMPVGQVKLDEEPSGKIIIRESESGKIIIQKN